MLRSCDLPTLDCFLWGSAKAHIHTGEPVLMDALEENIKAFIPEKAVEMSERDTTIRRTIEEQSLSTFT